ncbi:MAG: molybdopterin biosynthesis protein [Clostridia bacterium]
MAYQYLSNTPLTVAVADYVAIIEQELRAVTIEIIPTTEALGRITASASYAKLCSPHYNASAMDGIALSAALTFGATETTPVVLSSEQFVVVDTGDPLPQGSDSVVMVEDIINLPTGAVKLYSAAVPWQNVRQIGEDICAGDMLLPSYTEITPAAMGAILAGGVLELAVVKLPIVGIIPTGDEIVAPSANPQIGEIMEFNSTIFAGFITQWGCIPKIYPIVKDNRELITAAIEQALNECDVVILNAGSSAGREDFAKEIIAKFGRVLYHGIAIKPGKPAILAISQGKPILGVPGYPVSGIIVLDKILKPVLAKLTKRAIEPSRMIQASLAVKVNSSLKYQEYVRTRLGIVEKKWIAVPLNRGAGVVTSFVKADGMLEIPQNTEGYEAGTEVEISLLRPWQEITNMLVVTGSHDPLIDEVADLLKIEQSGVTIASSHVGSMGGIMAIKRKEAHLGGIHLLEEKTGDYNISYLEKYFPQGGVTLVEGVLRKQGLMVAKGNPHNIQGFADLANEKIAYVNRQKGSGTRILCDYLLQQVGLSIEQIVGYERVEFTHTAVAAQIAAGTADAGLGIYSAAKIYDLDFIPICNEAYDFLILASAMESKQVQKFLQVLQSKELQERLIALGGYEVHNIGKVKYSK